MLGRVHDIDTAGDRPNRAMIEGAGVGSPIDASRQTRYNDKSSTSKLVGDVAGELPT